MGFGNDFLVMTSKTQTTTKIDKLDYINIKKFFALEDKIRVKSNTQNGRKYL